MSLNLDGPEGRNITGEFAENEIKSFFSNFINWELIYENFDVKFLKKNEKQKKGGKPKKENRGFDCLYELYEPSESSKQGIIIECKKIKNCSTFSPGLLNEHINVLKDKIMKSQKSTELYRDEKIRHYEIETYNYGILCYRFIKFDLDNYQKCLKEVQIVEKISGTNFPVIFVLSNDRISAFMHLKNQFKGQNIEYYSFPINGNRGAPRKSKQMPLFCLFSDLIPFRVGDKNGILTFDFPSPRAFQLINDYCLEFNYDLSYIAFARNDYTQERLYNQYKSEFSELNMPEIKTIYLNNDMDCSQNLSEVFV